VSSPLYIRMKQRPIHLVPPQQVERDRKTLGECIRRHRKQQVPSRRTISKAATIAGVSRAVFSRAEKGADVGFDKLLLISPVVGLRVALMGEWMVEDGKSEWRTAWMQGIPKPSQASPDGSIPSGHVATDSTEPSATTHRPYYIKNDRRD
jgi:hypothetical protein